MKQIEIIEKKCAELKLNVFEVFREAKISKDTIHNWKKKEPKSFDTLTRINEAIERMSLEKSLKDGN